MTIPVAVHSVIFKSIGIIDTDGQNNNEKNN